MLVKLSTKGRVVIPIAIRQQLMLQSGSELEIRLVDRDIVIRPLRDNAALCQAVDSLYGMFADADFMGTLQTVRQEELAALNRIIQVEELKR